MTISELIASMRAARIDPDQILDAIIEHEKGRKKGRKAAPSRDENPIFERIWQSWPEKARKRSPKGKSLERFNEALRDHTAEDIERAAALYVRSPDAKKESGQFAPTLERWLRQGFHVQWLEDARPKDTAAETIKIELGDSVEHRFLAECRKDGANEWKIASWSKDYSGLSIHGRACVLVSRTEDFQEAFGPTIKRLGMSIFTEAYWKKREASK